MTEKEHSPNSPQAWEAWLESINESAHGLTVAIDEAADVWHLGEAEAQSARRLLTELLETLVGGRPSEAVAMAMRSRRFWVEECRRTAGAIVATAHKVDGLYVAMRARLAKIDARAADLQTTQIRDAITRKQTTSLYGVAARLAVECGAFDYKPGDFKKAKRAFESADRAPSP